MWSGAPPRFNVDLSSTLPGGAPEFRHPGALRSSQAMNSFHLLTHSKFVKGSALRDGLDRTPAEHDRECTAKRHESPFAFCPVSAGSLCVVSARDR
jgi:hypothetical protein